MLDRKSAVAPKPKQPAKPEPKKMAAAPRAEFDPATSEIRWTPKKVALLRALSSLKATSEMHAVTVEEAIDASKGEANKPSPAFDMTVQGYISWARHEGERFNRVYLTPKGAAKLKELTAPAKKGKQAASAAATAPKGCK
jgi:hypothetical protein